MDFPAVMARVEPRDEAAHAREVALMHEWVPRADIKNYVVTLKFSGPWHRDSYIVLPGSDLAKIKSEFLEKLLAANIIAPEDLDVRNQVAHVDVGGDKRVAEYYEGREILVNGDTVKFEPNLVRVSLGAVAGPGANRHITLVFKRGILVHQAQVQNILAGILEKHARQLALEPARAPEQKEAAPQEERGICVVCMDRPYNMLFEPCKHLAACHECAPHLSFCPQCRAKIAKATPIFPA